MNELWLPPVSLEGAIGSPTVAHVDDDGIYVGYGQAFNRYNLDGTQQTHLINAQNNVMAIHSDGDLLLLNHTSGLYARFLSIDKDTNTVIDTIESYVDSVYDSSIAPEKNRIFGRTQGISPSDITYISYDDQGNFSASVDSPYHGDYPSVSETWVFPSGSKVVDDSGTIYSTDSLTRLGSFGTRIGDIGFFAGEIPIIL
ncbi:MAG: hypothetical protein H8E66_28275 [Planctomycetes bacterium]|nr:hypothetical protein [Planctomycetota bacterium]